ncbi:hypothetical protein [Deinococcus multiflagellatus]|uniref:Uncharacterized protein n=1 Tax=Deinococcus multiflagellatus TaxID=1656887 RepID=A0ABW1ZTH8_9DEIO|nr:hypothetical protein [Deinococcus multiflagellatus]MBZ9714482.1 hypothetical protein [Deinococcus multiflagellatus]
MLQATLGHHWLATCSPRQLKMAVRMGLAPLSSFTDQFEEEGRHLAVVRAPTHRERVYHAGHLPQARRQAYLTLSFALQQACLPVLHLTTMRTLHDQLLWMSEVRDEAGDEANDHVERLWRLYEEDVSARLPHRLTQREQQAKACIAKIAALTAPLHVPLQGWEHYHDDYSECLQAFAVLSPAATPEDQAAFEDLHEEYGQMLWLTGEDPQPLAVYLLSDRKERALYQHAERITPRVVSLCRRALHDLVPLGAARLPDAGHADDPSAQARP